MPTAAVALRAAIHDALVANGALSALLGGSKVYDEPPTGAAFPYVTLGDARIEDFSAGNDPAEEHRLTLHAWSRQGGHKEAHMIAGALLQARADAPDLLRARGEELPDRDPGFRHRAGTVPDHLARVRRRARRRGDDRARARVGRRADVYGGVTRGAFRNLLTWTCSDVLRQSDLARRPAQVLDATGRLSLRAARLARGEDAGLARSVDDTGAREGGRRRRGK